MSPASQSRVLIWAVHRTQDWWAHVGQSMGFAETIVVTDRRGVGDDCVTDDFYAAYNRTDEAAGHDEKLIDDATLADVIARCRVLRSLPVPQAEQMVRAMVWAVVRLLDRTTPDLFVCFPIDNYVSDLIARLGRARGVPCFEVTASAIPGMTMLMHRGRLITVAAEPDPAVVAYHVAALADPLFAPTYVRPKRRYSTLRFLQIFAYFRLRGWVFRAWSILTGDPLRFHFLDAGARLGHRVDLHDIRIGRMIHHDWRERLLLVPRERRVLFGLQLIPEAAIDYWIEDLSLVQHEAMLVESATQLTRAGYIIVVKDHPLQFGFRQTRLIETLASLPGTIIVPYHVSGNEMLALCGVSLTATGTLGLQAALLGNVSIVGEAYYATPEDFVVVENWDGLTMLAAQASAMVPDREAASDRIVGRLLRGSFVADFFSFKRFDRARPSEAATTFGRALGDRILQLLPDSADWHRRAMPRGGGRWPGSPLN